jgi:cell division protein FtsZ
MDNEMPNPASNLPHVRVFGVGDAGIRVVDLLIADGLAPACCAALSADGPTLERSTAQARICVENRKLRGLGSGGDPERGRQAAEEKAEELKALCAGAQVVFIVAGLGGGSGTGISPVLARIAKASGALVLGFVTMPFDCECPRRLALADDGLEELKSTADGVICLPNQRIFKLIDENTTVVDTFKISNRLWADGVQGLWRLICLKGLIEIPLDDLLRLLQDRHAESAFAVAEAAGSGRATQVLEKLLAHPLLENGEVLPEAEVALVSLTAGTDLTMAEVNRVMEQIKAKCSSAQVLMGACVDERFGDRLAVTLITGRKPSEETPPRGHAEGLDKQLLDRKASYKPNSRFLPPPPSLAPDQVQKLLARQGRTRNPQKNSSKLRQTQLPLDIISRGRFDKSEPTIYKGEDLDVPTYIRRGIPLTLN